MHHLIAYTNSAARNYAYVAIAGLTDQSMTPRGNGYVIPAPINNMAIWYVMGTHVLRAQIQSPSIRKNWFIDVDPIDQAVLTPTMPAVNDNRDGPVPLAVGEELDVFAFDDQVAAQQDYAAIVLSDGPIVPVATSKQWTIRATTTTTLTGNAWSLTTLTFPSPLPAENYSIQGARFHSATGFVGRLVIPGYQWRPGFLCYSTVAKHCFNMERYGNMGIWGQFNVASPPQAEFVATAADTTEVVDLDLVPMP